MDLDLCIKRVGSVRECDGVDVKIGVGFGEEGIALRISERSLSGFSECALGSNKLADIAEVLVLERLDIEDATEQWGLASSTEGAREIPTETVVPEGFSGSSRPVGGEEVDAVGVVEVEWDVFKDPGIRIEIQEVVVRAVPDVVPLPVDTIHGHGSQEGIDIEPVIDLRREGRVVSRFNKENEVREVRVLVDPAVVLEFVGQVPEVGVGVRVSRIDEAEVRAGAFVGALVEVPGVVAEPCGEELVVDLFDICVDIIDERAVVDDEPDHRGTGGGDPERVEDIPRELAPDDGCVVLMAVDVEFFEPEHFPSRHELIKLELPRFLDRAA